MHINISIYIYIYIPWKPWDHTGISNSNSLLVFCFFIFVIPFSYSNWYYSHYIYIFFFSLLVCSQAWTATTPTLQGCPSHHAWSSALYAGPLLAGGGCHALYGVPCVGLALTVHSGTTALPPLFCLPPVLGMTCLGRKMTEERKSFFKWSGHVSLQWT